MLVQPLLQTKSHNYYTFWVCIGKVRYPARITRVAYFHLWPIRLYKIFHIKRLDFREKVLEYELHVLIFSATLSEQNPILRRIERGMIKKKFIGLLVKYRYSCQILIKLAFSRQIFYKSSNIKFHKNPSTRSRVVSYGKTDGRPDR